MFSKSKFAKLIKISILLLIFNPVYAKSRDLIMLNAKRISAPVAEQQDKIFNTHDDKRIDPYYWLNEKQNPKVIKYLEQEADYTKKITANLKNDIEKIADEIKTRIPEDDETAPYKRGKYWYSVQTIAGKDYPVYLRRDTANLRDKSQILLDLNELAKGKSVCKLGSLKVSPKEDKIVYSLDFKGDRKYEVFVKDIKTGQVTPTGLKDISGSVQWGNDEYLFYITIDEVTLRPNKVYRHKLGSNPLEDKLVYEEKDVTFGVFIGKTKSKKYLIIGSNQTLTSEYRYLDLQDPTVDFKLFQKRERGHEYSVDHVGDTFYILSNSNDAKNFKLLTTKDNATAMSNWQELISHSDTRLLEGVELFSDRFAIAYKEDGLEKIAVHKYGNTKAEYTLDFPEPSYSMHLGANVELDSKYIRIQYSSQKQPPTVYDYNLLDGSRKLIKVQDIKGGFNPDNYISERVFAKAKDGTLVPISLVYNKKTKLGDNPLLLYGYGSYGHAVAPGFSAGVISLLDRGFVYAIAHIRGGDDLGRKWYDDGKHFNKMNTFNDFIACAEHLKAKGYVNENKLYAEGHSAGGLLMGTVINMRSDLFHGVIAGVPFVDVITTMLDDSIPLTTGEYDEWGNPNHKEDYMYIKQYSPYDNVKKQAYPHLLVITGFNDSQVQYFEPAKWVAKLRQHKTNDNLLLFKINMEQGHSGASARYEAYKEQAFEYAFLLALSGLSV